MWPSDTASLLLSPSANLPPPPAPAAVASGAAPLRFLPSRWSCSQTRPLPDCVRSKAEALAPEHAWEQRHARLGRRVCLENVVQDLLRRADKEYADANSAGSNWAALGTSTMGCKQAPWRLLAFGTCQASQSSSLLFRVPRLLLQTQLSNRSACCSHLRTDDRGEPAAIGDNIRQSPLACRHPP